jgi:hypothetical protein
MSQTPEVLIDFLREFVMKIRRRMEIQRLSGDRPDWEGAAEMEIDQLETNPDGTKKHY